jgi:hypothetical protein
MREEEVQGCKVARASNCMSCANRDFSGLGAAGGEILLQIGQRLRGSCPKTYTGAGDLRAFQCSALAPELLDE